jgi:UDP-N-acetylglucosamine--N-acetylmuramyl-(pentapeptide) pyrophosphoryl-undecaprenol N-acetylglucosamine transferase
VAEVTAAGKSAIFVPFPHAADNHQLCNAQALEKAGAAILIPETELTPDALASKLQELFRDPGRLEQMSQAARRLAHPQAAAEIATLAARLAGGEAASKNEVRTAEV